MNRPPMMMHLKIKNEKTDFGLWLPLFLIALVTLAVVIVFLPLIIIAFLIMLMCGLERYVRYTLLSIWALILSLWATRGLVVDVENARDRIYISII